MWGQLYEQTANMISFILRRDRIRLPIWIISLTAITVITASAFPGLYSSDQERQAIAETMKNPAMTAMVGPGYGLDDYTEGAMMAHQMLLFTAIAVAIMSILIVTRHTRTDEEEGRVELIRSLPVGRLANVMAAMVVLLGTNILLAVIIGFSLFSLGIESIDLQGSLLYGAALGGTGIFFAAVTALFAQLSESSRGTIGYSFALLGVAYLVRAIGAVSSEALSWFSPLGWILRTEVYVNNRWWPLLLTVGIAFIIGGVALYLNRRRDLGAGILPSKPGKKNASPLLQSPFGLALRLQRTSIIAWAVGMFILGASYGSIFGDLESFLANNEMMRQAFEPIEGLTLTEQFLTMLMSIISMICTIPPIMFVLKLKGEEKRNRTEHLLARAVSRMHVMGSYFVLSVLFGFLMLLLALTGLWLAASSVMEEPISLGTLYQAGLAYLPAMWMMIGLAMLLIGLIPQMTGITWLYLGYSFFVVYLGGLLQFPEWLGQLSPFGHIPQLPVEDLNILSVSVLTGLAAILAAIGFIGYRKRDLAG
ncbi:ABC transporter permease [Halalkalibacterium halodurans]|uniref:ABC transporter permease n=1 Tax=Halalkalibacterium halodurans TaxID=86665 RepID=UPI002E209E6B|nr:ABC transporter permease [Halalkalibacterium halodurans]